MSVYLIDSIAENLTALLAYIHGKQNELYLSDLEWYKCVPQTSHLSKYAKSAEKANYEWDGCGNLVSE